MNNEKPTEPTDYSKKMKPTKFHYEYIPKALNLLIRSDSNYDIENAKYDEFWDYWDIIEYCVFFDPEPFRNYLVNHEPVYESVKRKYIELFVDVFCYQSAGMAQKYLRTKPVPAERTYQRKKEKILKTCKSSLNFKVELASGTLQKIKEHPEKPIDEKPEVFQAFTSLLNFPEDYGLTYEEEIRHFEWLLENDVEELKKLFEFEVHVEVKHRFFELLLKYDSYHLCAFFDKYLNVIQMGPYFEIPAYIPDPDEQDYGSYQDPEEKL